MDDFLAVKAESSFQWRSNSLYVLCDKPARLFWKEFSGFVKEHSVPRRTGTTAAPAFCVYTGVMLKYFIGFETNYVQWRENGIN